MLTMLRHNQMLGVSFPLNHSCLAILSYLLVMTQATPSAQEIGDMHITTMRAAQRDLAMVKMDTSDAKQSLAEVKDHTGVIHRDVTEVKGYAISAARHIYDLGKEHSQVLDILENMHYSMKKLHTRMANVEGVVREGNSQYEAVEERLGKVETGQNGINETSTNTAYVVDAINDGIKKGMLTQLGAVFGTILAIGLTLVVATIILFVGYNCVATDPQSRLVQRVSHTTLTALYHNASQYYQPRSFATNVTASAPPNSFTEPPPSYSVLDLSAV